MAQPVEHRGFAGHASASVLPLTVNVMLVGLLAMLLVTMLNTPLAGLKLQARPAPRRHRQKLLHSPLARKMKVRS